jgi:hypothetical protein
MLLWLLIEILKMVFIANLSVYSIIILIWTVYVFFIKCLCSHLYRFSIFGSIGALYRLSIVSFYRHHYTKYIWIAYNVVYKGSLYFGIPGVLSASCLCKLEHHTTVRV